MKLPFHFECEIPKCIMGAYRIVLHDSTWLKTSYTKLYHYIQQVKKKIRRAQKMLSG